MLVQPWNLSHEEFIDHAFDQLRQTCLTLTEVAAALRRVLRMLRGYVHQQGRDELVPALARQMRLLIDGLDRQPELHPADPDRLAAISADDTDPADHSL